MHMQTFDTYLLRAADSSASAASELLTLEQTFTSKPLSRQEETDPFLQCFVYIAERSELLYLDTTQRTHILRLLRMPAGELDPRDVYTSGSLTRLRSVCYVPETNYLIVGEGYKIQTSTRSGYWLVLLAVDPNTNFWISNQSRKVRIEWPPDYFCPLSDARVICGELNSKNMVLYRVNSDGHVALVKSVRVDRVFSLFLATRSTDTLVVMSIFVVDIVVLCRLVGTDLQTNSAIKLPQTGIKRHFLWIDVATILATYMRCDAFGSHVMVDLEVRHNQLIQRPEKSGRVVIVCWCLLANEQIALFDDESTQLHVYRLLLEPQPLHIMDVERTPAASHHRSTTGNALSKRPTPT